jgi:hypothetical protein
MTPAIAHTGRTSRHRFYLNPEANVGSGGAADGDAGADGESRRTAVPDSTTRSATTPAVTGATPDPATESTTTH